MLVFLFVPTQISQNEVGGKEERKSNVYTLWKDQNSSMVIKALRQLCRHSRKTGGRKEMGRERKGKVRTNGNFEAEQHRKEMRNITGEKLLAEE